MRRCYCTPPPGGPDAWHEHTLDGVTTLDRDCPAWSAQRPAGISSGAALIMGMHARGEINDEQRERMSREHFAAMYPPITTADKIQALLNHLNADEQEVVLRITQRLVMGAEQYGKLSIDTDPRNWAEQAAEEAFDGSVYHAILAIKLSRAAGGK